MKSSAKIWLLALALAAFATGALAQANQAQANQAQANQAQSKTAAPAETSKKTSEKASKQTSAKTKGSSNEAQIRELYDRWKKAFEARDLEAIMACYAPGDAVVAYDIVPPLEYKGYDAYRKDYQEFLDMFEGPIAVEYREMRIAASGDVAFIHALERVTAKGKNGQPMDMWLRATSGLRKIKGKWLIVHDHISEPTDMATGKSAMDLKPE